MDKYYKQHINEYKSRFAIIVICFCFVVLLGIPIPLLTKFLIDDVLVNSNLDLVPLLCLVFCILIVIQIVFGRLIAWITSAFTQDFINELREKIVRGFLKSKSPRKHLPGKLMVVISSDTVSLGHINLSIVSTICRSFFSIIGYTTMLFVLSYKLAIVALALFPIYFFWIRHVSIKIQELTKKSQAINEELLASVESIDSNNETIEIYGYGEVVGNTFGRLVEYIGAFLKRVAMYQNFVGSVSGVIISAASFITLVVGIYLVADGEITLGVLITFNAYAGMLFAPLSNLIELNTKTRLIAVHEERVDEILHADKQEEEKRGDTNSSGSERQLENGIRIDSYELYAYQHRLVGVDHAVFAPNEVSIIKGGNATGKTLFLKTIAHLYDNYSGSIYVDGEGIEEMSQNDIRLKVLYVSPNQDFVLPTIGDELFTNSKLGDEELYKLIELFGLQDSLCGLPNEFLTSTKELTKYMNMGSIQKLKILRALTRKPNYLLLDEMLSHIEINQCEAILSLVRSSFPNMSVIIVEHHVNIDEYGDKIYWIKNGQFVHIG